MEEEKGKVKRHRYTMEIPFRVTVVEENEEYARDHARDLHHDYAHDIGDSDVVMISIDDITYEDLFDVVVEHGLNVSLITTGKGFYDRRYEIRLSDGKGYIHAVASSNLPKAIEECMDWIEDNEGPNDSAGYDHISIDSIDDVIQLD